MPNVTLSVSVPVEQWEFVKKEELSFSELLRKTIEKLMAAKAAE